MGRNASLSPPTYTNNRTSLTRRMQRGVRVTQSAIAERLGVSQALVSMVMNGRGLKSIPLETQSRVLEAARRVDYVPDRAAQMLRARRTWTIACVVPDITNPFYPALERGVQEVALNAGFDVLAVNTDGLAERERRLIDWCRQGRIDGLVGVFFSLTPADLQPLEVAGTPAVCVGWRSVAPGATVVDSLFTDNVRAAREATRYLIGRGHRLVAMLGADNGPGPERISGYVAAMHDAGLSPLVDIGDGFTEEAGYTLMTARLRSCTRPTAVFAANDLMAAGALLAAREVGLDVPKDVAVMGFDDIQFARLLTPTLTTVNQHQQAVGREAASMLLERLAEPASELAGRSREMPFDLVKRHSA